MTPTKDCVNSIPGKTLSKGDVCGLNTPKRSAPLANGGRTNGMMTATLTRKLPGNLYLAKQNARGIPKMDIRIVEIDAEIMLRTKASITLGRVNESNRFSGSAKIKILARG
jgi:hypothetical protein